MGLQFRFVPVGTQLQGEGDLPSGIVFASAWSSATGTGTLAVFDESRTVPWDGTGNENSATDEATVIATAGSGLAWPTTNFLRITGTGSTFVQLVVTGQWTAPAIGQSVALRFYRRMLFNYNPRETESHGTYFDSTGTAGWGPTTLGLYDQTPSGITGLAPVLTVEANASGGETVASGDRYWWAPNADRYAYLVRDAIYRYEILYSRTGANTFTIRYAIYDINDNLIIDDSDMNSEFWNNTAEGGFLTNQTFTSSGAGANGMTGLKIGINGLQPETVGTNIMEFAAVIVLKGATNSISWPVGPYTAAEDDWEP